MSGETDEGQYLLGMRLDELRPLIAALSAGFQLACVPNVLNEFDDGRIDDAEALGDGSARRSPVDGSDYPL